jgi:hypothetical protein
MPPSSFTVVLTAGPHSSGFHGSRFCLAQNSCQWDPRFPDEQNVINDFPVGPLPDGTDLMPRVLPDGRSRFLWDFETFDVLFPSTSGTLISRWPICRRRLDLQHLSLRWTVPIPPRISDFRCQVTLSFQSPDHRCLC